ncbi:MAG: hypothetical protein R3316_11310 [Rhodovibrionaceae bacterium]|nr:hypothetical protein [Rhodovibrionaceae bacterium]
MKPSSRAVLTAAALTAALGLAACEEDEQDRVLMYEPGTYLGQEDTPLAEEKVNDLRQRAKNQGRL